MADEPKPSSNIPVDMTVAIAILLVVLGLFGAYFRSAFQWYFDFLNWWYSQNWSRIYFASAIVFSTLNVAVIAFIIMTIRKYAKINKLFPYEEAPPKEDTVSTSEQYKILWEEIKTLANSQSPSDWNMAVIRADTLLDDILKKQGTEGETMADRLKITDPGKIPSIERVWSAHRLRNAIVHGNLEPQTRETIVFALRTYELALKELGILKEDKAE